MEEIKGRFYKNRDFLSTNFSKFEKKLKWSYILMNLR
jgi:hypothetical protein